MTTTSTLSGREYWAVDCPGLSAMSAEALVAFAQDLPGVLGSSAIDPRHWYSRNFDISTINAIVYALKASIECNVLVAEVHEVIEPVVDDMHGWAVAAQEPGES